MHSVSRECNSVYYTTSTLPLLSHYSSCTLCSRHKQYTASTALLSRHTISRHDTLGAAAFPRTNPRLCTRLVQFTAHATACSSQVKLQESDDMTHTSAHRLVYTHTYTHACRQGDTSARRRDCVCVMPLKVATGIRLYVLVVCLQTNELRACC